MAYNLLEYPIHTQELVAEISKPIHQDQRFSCYPPCVFVASAEHQPQKRKRTRTVYCAFQLSELEREFQHNMYMFRRHRCKVAQRLNLSEAQVKIWFQNRRMRLKRDLRDLHENNSMAKPSKSQSNAHNQIVKRLMSYSQDAGSLLMSYSQDAGSVPHNSTLDLFVGQAHQRKSSTQIDSSMVAVQPSSTQEVAFNLDSSVSYDPKELDLLLQSLKYDLEPFTQSQHLFQAPHRCCSNNKQASNAIF